MKYKQLLLIAALAVSLTLAVVQFTHPSQPLLSGGVRGDDVHTTQPAGPVLAGGSPGGVLGDRADASRNAPGGPVLTGGAPGGVLGDRALSDGEVPNSR